MDASKEVNGARRRRRHRPKRARLSPRPPTPAQASQCCHCQARVAARHSHPELSPAQGQSRNQTLGHRSLGQQGHAAAAQCCNRPPSPVVCHSPTTPAMLLSTAMTDVPAAAAAERAQFQRRGAGSGSQRAESAAPELQTSRPCPQSVEISRPKPAAAQAGSRRAGGGLALIGRRPSSLRAQMGPAGRRRPWTGAAGLVLVGRRPGRHRRAGTSPTQIRSRRRRICARQS